ncbi:hypothetical protein PsorP6_010799 [Peronosclerospora sorghi]|uniref:Uncharacterized protein n=1 Tax=Peronosclerospora sorghi TaxID=230839 RepID=A0ACC0VVV0_9STRA|nr:hypothetical protein PsorP6_010799 [Peronosclerospora sorghi]
MEETKRSSNVGNGGVGFVSAGGVASNCHATIGRSKASGSIEEKKLVAAVTQRARILQDLEHVVRKQVRVVQYLATLDELDLLEKKPRVEDKDTLLYTTYFEHLDARYGNVDEVFATVGLNPTPGGILSGKPTKKRLNGWHRVFRDNWGGQRTVWFSARM